jgi:DNA polymerase-1
VQIKCATPEAYALLHEGSVELSRVEANGMRVDTRYLKRAIKFTGDEIMTLEQQLREDDIFRTWRKRFGEKTTLGNRKQLGTIVFDVLKYPRTSSNNDEEAFAGVDLPFVQKYFQLQKKLKVKNTYLAGIAREVENGFIHPFFSLHTVVTYRGSSDTPNFQNLPIRNPEMGKIIRSCFIARENHVLVENDFGGIEVRVVCCYNKDPVLIDYICDSTKDMHRDVAAKCYCLPTDQVSKTIRYCGKNQFVFPEFYGSYYVDCAKNLWQSILGLNLETVGGVPVGDMLERKGIVELGACDPSKPPRKGTFEHHVKQVEEELWNKFKVYARWKRDWWEGYLKRGYISTLTGFVLQGIYRRNQIINSPVQGSAFHILLKSLILLNRRLRKNKMRTKIVGQIHDSLIADCHKDELQDYLAMVKEVTTVEVPKLWKWIIVPLEIEAEVAPVGGTWYEKAGVKI